MSTSLRIVSAVKAGGVYFVAVFLFGFVLGTARTLIVLPRLGETVGVVLEAPVILAISWVTCAWCVDRFRVPSGAWIRLLMGAAAFSLLGVAEISISLFVFGRTIASHFAGYRSSASAIGLVAQVVFAIFPQFVGPNRGLRGPAKRSAEVLEERCPSQPAEPRLPPAH